MEQQQCTVLCRGAHQDFEQTAALSFDAIVIQFRALCTRTYSAADTHFLEQAQVFRVSTCQDPEGLRWHNHGHPKHLCTGIGRGKVGMLGPLDILPGAGAPQLPHVLSVVPLLEQASGRGFYQVNVTSATKTDPKSGWIRAGPTPQGHRTPRG